MVLRRSSPSRSREASISARSESRNTASANGNATWWSMKLTAAFSSSHSNAMGVFIAGEMRDTRSIVKLYEVRRSTIVTTKIGIMPAHDDHAAVLTGLRRSYPRIRLLASDSLRDRVGGRRAQRLLQLSFTKK